MAKKVFELAKELDVNSLELVEKLKDLGFSVRNHMSSLSDDDLVKFGELTKTDESSKKTKKKSTKKKAAKKKTTKKTVKKASTDKVTTVKAAAPSESADESSEDKPKKKVTVRKKAVIRKKAKSLSNESAEETTAAHAAVESAPTKTIETAVEAPVLNEQPEEVVKAEGSGEEKINTESDGHVVESSPENDKKTFGLNIVSRPEPTKTEEPVKDETVAQVEEVEEKKEEVVEKPRFGGLRVVAMPSKSDLEKQAREKEEQSQSNGGTNSNESDEERVDAKGGTYKKRLGGLAAMINGKEPVVRGSLNVNEQRADNKLRSYSTLSS